MTITVYLAGPITGVSKKDLSWQDEVASYLSLITSRDQVEVLKVSRFLDHLELDGKFACNYDDPLISRAALCARSLFEVKRSDIVLANLSISDKLSIGTLMEISWAYQLGIPVICVGGPGCEHPMVESACLAIVDTLEEALDTLVTLGNIK